MSSWLNRFLAGVALLPALAMASYPAYKWHTFFGGDINDAENLPATVVDANGNLYVTGATRFPWDSAGNPASTFVNGYQAYLTKISPSGQLIWSSFFINPGWPWGRQDGLRPRGIALDSAGNIYISGAGIIDPHNCTDCGSFVLETDPNGAFLGGVNFGGPKDSIYDNAWVWGMTYNSADNYVYITGNVGNGWYGPGRVLNAGGPQNMFILQVGSLASGGAGLGWVGLYGPHLPWDGEGVWGQGIAADADKNLYVTGIDGGSLAVWKVDHTGTQVWENVYGLGTGYAVATYGANVYVTGFTRNGWSGPEGEAPLNAYTGWTQAFVLKVDTDGSYIWHTFYHGTWAQCIGEGIAVDGPTTLYVAGPGDLVGYNDAAPLHGGPGDGHFILQLDDHGAYQWHSLYGVPRWDEANSIAVDPNHDVYVSGWTGWATWNGDSGTLPLHGASGAASEVFVMKFGSVKATPVITWSNPADVVFGTALGSTQLNATADVPGTFVYTPAAGTVLPAGTGQTLSVTFTPDNAAAYNSATQTVAINVTKATPVITWSNPADIAFGTALGTTQLNATANVPGTFVYSKAVGTLLPTGAGQTLSVTFTPTDAGDYTIASKSVVINVTKATPVITWSNPADIVFATALTAAQLNATANVPGTFVYTPAAGTVLPVGALQTLSTTFTPTDATDYTPASKSVQINVKSPAQIVVTKTLARVGGQVVVSLNISNPGGADALNVQLTVGKIGNISGTLQPPSLGTVAAGKTVPATLTFPGTVGASSTAAVLTVSGTYTGGSFSSASRIVLP